MSVSRPKSARRAFLASSIRTFALNIGSLKEGGETRIETYPLKVTVNHSVAVYVDQTLGDTCQLNDFQLAPIRGIKVTLINGGHTSPSRSTSGFASTNSLILPLVIHSDTIANRFS